jgi:hypothetical protein
MVVAVAEYVVRAHPELVAWAVAALAVQGQGLLERLILVVVAVAHPLELVTMAVQVVAVS